MISGSGKGGFGGGSGGTGRKVTYEIGVIADPKAKKTMDDLAKSATDLDKRMKAAGDNGKKSTDFWAKGMGELSKQTAAVNKQMDTWSKGQKAWQAGIGNIAKENNARLKEQERAIERTSRAQTLAANQLKRAHRDTERSFDKILSGTTSLGRAFAVSGLIGEKSMNRVLDVLLKVEAISAAVHGGTAVARGFQGLARSHAAAQAASGVAGSAAGQAAGGAAGGLIGRFGPKAVGLGAAGLGVIGGLALAELTPDVPPEGQTRYDLRTGRFHQVGLPDNPETYRVKTIGEGASKLVRKQQIELQGIEAGDMARAANADFAARRATLIGNAAYRGAFARDNGQREFAGLHRARGEYGSLAGDEGATAEQVASARGRVLQIEQQIRQARESGARAELEMSRAALEVAKQRESMVRERGLSVGQRFGQLNPGEQFLAETAIRGTMKGQWQPPQMRGLAERVAGDVPRFQEAQRGIDLKNAGNFFDQGGIFDVLGLRRDEKVAKEERKVIAGEVKFRNDVTVQLVGGEEMSDQVIKKLGPLLKKQDDQQREILNREIRALELKLSIGQNVQREAEVQ